ncbi:nuclear transport factor 2 family protein [Streptomyces harbinensis]|uniref:nuclear transport factor 2 family protein n=1 Tax=Streptomyces harbinensis TaxID=1176198 RepID=UPI0037205632
MDHDRTGDRDHHAIATLISRYFLALDRRTFDDDPEWSRPFHTDDIQALAPIGTVRGHRAVTRQTEQAIRRYARTQHCATDLLTTTDPLTGHATATWNALMTHVHHDPAHGVFTVGGRCEAELVRTGPDDGWRFSRIDIEAVWTTGRPPVLS